MSVQQLLFKGCHSPVILVGCPELIEVMQGLAPSWAFSAESVSEEKRCHDSITIRKSIVGYVRTSAKINNPIIYADPVDAVCDFLVDLVKFYNDAHPQFMCLHAAAVAYQGGLILFPNTYNVGKSLLSAHLIAKGAKLFSDDVIPIDDVTFEGISLGCRARLRLPLPDNITSDFDDFYNQRRGVVSRQFQYLNLSNDEQADFAERLPIRAIVLLDRKPHYQTMLSQANLSDVIKAMVLRNFARQSGGRNILENLISLASNVPCYRLRYGDCHQGSKMLINRFTETWTAIPAPRHSNGFTNDVAGQRCDQLGNGAALIQGEYRRTPEVFSKAIDDDRFLVNARNNMIFHLNTMASIVWDLIETPVTIETVTTDLCQLFPDTDNQTIKNDAEMLFKQLLRNDLVQTAS